MAISAVKEEKRADGKIKGWLHDRTAHEIGRWPEGIYSYRKTIADVPILGKPQNGNM
jgi:hypothetical protein